MKRKLELLAPGGDIDSIKAAIAAGADAVYCGLNKFNARNRATNINFDQLTGVIRLAHKHHCKIFLTLNILITGHEIPALIRLLNKLVNTSIDGIIIQDFGLFYLLSKYFKGLEIHASTQLNTHNAGQINFLGKLNADRVNLARELNVDEIKTLALNGAQNKLKTEVFVHGSYCISFSGLCYMSSVHGGNSGNRGRCSQPCRDRYVTTPEGKDFPLNLKDNSAYLDLRELYGAGVHSLKIEGRIKSYDYVWSVVNCWKKNLRNFHEKGRVNKDNRDLYKVFNRDFSNGYLKGDIHKNMFIDSPRDNSIKLLSQKNYYSTDGEREESRIRYYREKAESSTIARSRIKQLSIDKIPLTIRISGKTGTPLILDVNTPEDSFAIGSETSLLNAGTTLPDTTPKDKTDRRLGHDILFGRLKAVNDTAYYIAHMDLDNLEDDLFISFKELTRIKKRLLSRLSGAKEIFDPIEVPFLKKDKPTDFTTTLSVLISSKKDLHLSRTSGADLFFQLPDNLKDECSGLIDFFLENKKLTPWFPPVLIGENYAAARYFLDQVTPKRIVTNNTGLAYEACKNEIPWIAGPFLNITNSFSLLCLKENFNCSGAFISNELSRKQIKSIIKPKNFDLYYSIYHPISLMASRQCLIHQVTGCETKGIDEACIQNCRRSSSLTNLNGVPLFIEKAKGGYHCIYNHENFLNTDIPADFPGVFSGYCIDLRKIKTRTRTGVDNSGITALFKDFLNGVPGSENKLRQTIYPTTSAQYKKGI